MPTIHDIARRAQVSIATVSRVFNNRNDVQELTRDRVLQAARELNYEPHASARNLRRARSGKSELNYAVGIVFLNARVFTAEAFFVDLAGSVERSLREQGYRLSVLTASPDGNVPQEVQLGHLDGVICRGQGSIVQKMADLMPTVTLDTYDSQSDAFGVLPDYRKGVYDAVTRLLQAGRRHIALLTGAATKGDPLTFSSQVIDGCAQAYREAGLKPPKDLNAVSAGSLAEAYDAGLALLRNKATRPEVIVASDGIMLGVYRAAYELGLRIPDELSLLGIDGISNGAFFAPPLTTIDVNIAELGATAVRILTECISTGERRRGMLLMPVNILARASAAF